MERNLDAMGWDGINLEKDFECVGICEMLTVNDKVKLRERKGTLLPNRIDPFCVQEGDRGSPSKQRERQQVKLAAFRVRQISRCIYSHATADLHRSKSS